MSRRKEGTAGAAAAQEQNYMAKLMDELDAFEEFKAQFLPVLRKDLSAGLTPAQLREKYATLAQAAVVAALANPDPKVRQAAARDLLDRFEGTATQRIEQTHKLEKLPENELDAILATELGLIKKSDKVAH